MAEYQATFNKKDDDGKLIEAIPLNIEYNFGANLEEAKKLFGEEVVMSSFIAHSVVQLQSRMRALAKAGTLGKELQAKISEWKPGVVAPRKDPVEAMETKFDNMTPEKQAEFIERLRNKSKKPE